MRAYHTAVFGDSGSGKTTLLRETHAKFQGYSVWIDHDDVGGISGRDLEDAATVRSIAELKRADAHRIRFVVDDPRAALEDLRPIATSIYERTGWPCQVVIDEVQNVMPDGEDISTGNTCAQMLHEDRDQGVKLLIGSQDPQDVEYSPIKQARYLTWVGPPSPFHEGFRSYYRIDADVFPTERFQYVVWEKGRTPFEWEEVYRGQTDPAFS